MKNTLEKQTVHINETCVFNGYAWVEKHMHKKTLAIQKNISASTEAGFIKEKKTLKRHKTLVSLSSCL